MNRPLLTKLLAFGLAPLWVACERPIESAGSQSASSTSAAPAIPAHDAGTQAASSRPSAEPAAQRSKHALSSPEFAKLIGDLSEPDAEFFSDNFISNETSYLQVAPALEKQPTGGVYIGVGPEQNFTYIALTKPDVAYIVDIRRDNLVLQLLYKAAFVKATSRAHFLSLLLGRDYVATGAPKETAALEDVFDHVDRQTGTTESFRAAHQELERLITDEFQIALSKKDEKDLDSAHRAFFKDGLDIRFSLKQESFRKYPSLRELAIQEDSDGDRTGFLANETLFRVVQDMQRENRIVPVVGDFAGDGALPAIAQHMKSHQQVLRSFYVSNVEQYLMLDGKWWKWQRNIAALPSDDQSIFIRCYLDQGKAHPRQMAGHRTTTTLHRVAAFNARKKPFASMLALASEGVL